MAFKCIEFAEFTQKFFFEKWHRTRFSEYAVRIVLYYCKVVRRDEPRELDFNSTIVLAFKHSSAMTNPMNNYSTDLCVCRHGVH